MEPIDMFLTNIQDRIDFMRSMDEVSNHGVDNPAATNDNMDSLPVPSRQSNMPMQMFY